MAIDAMLHPPRPDMPYTYDHPRPAVTADVAAFSRRDGALRLLLVRRGGPPFAGQWALPGGFLRPDEDLAACAGRELKEETGMDAAELTLVGQFSAPGRDPRGRTITVAFLAMLAADAPAPKGADDAAAARWWAVDALPPLAFDHDQIVAQALECARRRDDLSPDLRASVMAAYRASRDRFATLYMRLAE